MKKEDTDNRANIRKEMAELRAEIAKSLRSFLNDKDIIDKLSVSEKQQVEKEFTDLDELLRRLETGLIYISLFGITSSGKSSIINSLLGEDLAKTGPEYGVTTEDGHYLKEPWMLVDVPGILDNQVNDRIAIEEAKLAIGHIFVVEKEPYGPELELFDLLYQNFKDSPRIVFVNKWDKQMHETAANRDIVKNRIISKMGKYVKDLNKDIIFGNAALKVGEKMVRQPLPQIEDRLYHDAGTLGEIINIIDPAHRASTLISDVKGKVIEVRRKVSRKITTGFALAAVGSSFIPFDSLLVAPGLFVGHFYGISSVMGAKISKENAGRITKEILKYCGEFLVAEFVALAVIEGIYSILTPIFGIGILLDYATLSYFKFRRTVIFGEICLAYIENDFSFGDDIRHTFEKAKEKANEQMRFYKNK